MTSDELYKLLATLGTEKNRKKLIIEGVTGNYFGVSNGNLNKLKRKVTSSQGKKGVNQQLAEDLWLTGNIDAQTFAIMIAEPEKLSEAVVEKWISDINYYQLADSLAVLIAKSAFARKKVNQWTRSEKEMKRRAGYTILGILATESKTLPDDYFIPFINKIQEEIHASAYRAKEGMYKCLIAIGERSERLKFKVIRAN